MKYFCLTFLLGGTLDLTAAMRWGVGGGQVKDDRAALELLDEKCDLRLSSFAFSLFTQPL